VARRQNKDGCVLDHGVLERDARTPFGSMTGFKHHMSWGFEL
jgi:hypothetical protein